MTVKSKKSSLTSTVDDYAYYRVIAKDAKKIVDNCIKVFKENGGTVFKSPKYTVVRKDTEFTGFDKDAFIAVYGEAVYQKFTKTGIRTEFVVVEN